MNDYRADVSKMLEVTSILSPSEYSWFGNRTGTLSRHLLRTLDDTTVRTHLVSELQGRLYQSFYCCGYARADYKFPEQTAIDAESTGFIRQLSNANRSLGFWSSGWRVQHISGAMVVVERDQLSLSVSKEHCQGLIVPGGVLQIRIPKEQFNISPGFYLAHGNTTFDSDRATALIRIYWNVTPTGAVSLMHYFTEQLNAIRVPFDFKVMQQLTCTSRCDGTVLYLARQDYEKAAEVLQRARHLVASWRGPQIPAFTKKLAPGIGLAEDPGANKSFGQDRCRILAEGIVQAHESGARSLAERLLIVERHFSKARISLDTPYLNPGSLDSYSRYDRTSQSQLSRKRKASDVGQSRITQSHALEIAHRVAIQIATEALWHDGRCTWLAPTGCSRGALSAQYSTLDPSLYDGCGGVALFLAETAAATNDDMLRETAVAALRQATSQIRTLPLEACLGLYSGWLGVAFCAARVACLFHDESLLEAALGIVQAARTQTSDLVEYDLVIGKAGGVLSLLAIHALCAEPSCLHDAERLGSDLINAAEQNEFGWSWRSPSIPAYRNLTGYSHGAAGVAHALAELFGATQHTAYANAAVAAFEYERHCFDVASQNWPDFRIGEGRIGRAQKFNCAWCHGAPGIAVSRFRSQQVLRNDSGCSSDARIALRTTRTWLGHWAASAVNTDACLCHGFLGNAEILLQASQLPALSEATDRELILHAAARAHDLCSNEESSSIESAIIRKIPGLMTGLGGVGYFLLRLAKPKTPSILGLTLPIVDEVNVTCL